MNEKEIKETGKFMSYVLRHRPDSIGLQLTNEGWADILELIEKMNLHGQNVDISVIEKVVAANDKQRFAFNDARTHIRANQGHSINIALGLSPVEPPAFLFHGTVEKFLINIKEEGLKKMSRQHVHLSKDMETAKAVGGRRGKPIVLTVQSGKMYKDGYVFYLSGNGGWLTDKVDINYIEF